MSQKKRFTLYSAQLTPQEFAIHDTAERWEVDLKGEKVIYKHLEQNAQPEIGLLKLDWTDLQLSRWLDGQCRQPDLLQPVLLEFCRKIVAFLTTTGGLALNDLLRFKYQLAKAVQEKIAAYRQQAFADSYQTFLFSPQATVTTSFADGFAFDKRPYPAAWFYQGAYLRLVLDDPLLPAPVHANSYTREDGVTVVLWSRTDR